MNKTFEKWRNKVEIVPKFIGNVDDERNVRIDTFFKYKGIDCIKADIEGSERDMLLGGEDALKNKIKYVFMVGYHKNGYDEIIKGIPEKNGFKVSHNREYMIPWVWPHNFKSPYVRRGVIYGEKEKL